MIRSESDAPTTLLTNKDGKAVPRAVANYKNKVKQGANSGSSSEPSTSARTFLIDPGIGPYKVNIFFKILGYACRLIIVQAQFICVTNVRRLAL